MNFEIKYKDAMGRLGMLKTPHGTIRTPALMPVIHPGKQTLDVRKYGAEIVITNAYIMYKNEDLREKVLEEGVHRFINFPGPIVTDSGSFQLSIYGDIDVTNREIIEFQEAIGTDIGTSLDIPTPPFVKREQAEKDLEITLERAKEALDVRDGLMLNSVVQGSTFPDLRSHCADELGSMGFDVYPIGAVVPLMESYRYSELMDVVMASVTHLPDSQPRHLMGAGHPMVFAFAVAMGCDLFDSAAYILYAKNDRFMTPTGTYKLEDLVEMPCTCPVCTSYTPQDLRKMGKDERMRLIAQHNLHVSFAEIRKIRQALVDGSLMELVEQRCRTHPYLLDGLRNMKNYTSIFEKYDPVSKNSAFFYSGPESLLRPEIQRHLKRVERLPRKENLLVLPPSRKPYSKNVHRKPGNSYLKLSGTGKGSGNDLIKEQRESYDNFHGGSAEGLRMDKILKDLQIIVVDVPFAVIPLEIDEVYPLAQNESPLKNDSDSLKFVKETVERYIEGFSSVIIDEKVFRIYDFDFEVELCHLDPDDLNMDVADEERIRYVADYQFGRGSGNALFGDENQENGIKIVKSKKTGKIRHVYDGETLIVTLRASDGVFVLAREGAIRLHSHLEYPENRVVVNADAEPFARQGKSIFAKFIIDCDKDIKSNEEVLIVNQDDELIAFGKAILCGREMMSFKTGQAVKTRKGGL